MNNIMIYNDMLKIDKINLQLPYNMNIDDILKDLSEKMFHYIENENTDNKKKVSDTDTSLKNSNQNIPKFLKFVDYNKYNSKYNEKVRFHKLNDELFWLFYKLYYEKSEEDLLYTNLFLEEKSKKIELIEMINKKKINLKRIKTTKTHILEDLTNSIKIDIETFNALCLIFNVDILLVKDNKIYIFISNKSNEEFKNKTSFNKLLLEYYNLSNMSKSYKITFTIENTNINSIINNYLYVKNITKPLNSISSYKMEDIIYICKKINISLYLNDKKKTKQILYNEINNILN